MTRVVVFPAASQARFHARSSAYLMASAHAAGNRDGARLILDQSSADVDSVLRSEMVPDTAREKAVAEFRRKVRAMADAVLRGEPEDRDVR